MRTPVTRIVCVSFASCAIVLASACGTSGNTPAVKKCDAICQDSTGIHAMRDMIKLAYNITLQGHDVGPQDATQACPLGGNVHVFGTATSNAVQGATEVDLTYVFDHCGYAQHDDTPEQTYKITLTGTVTEKGTIAVQPSATTALSFASDTITVSGTVFNPPIDYAVDACPLTLGQNGNRLAGSMCSRDVGVTL